MGRVWGAMARLILLLLMAASFCKDSAALRRAPGADDYTGSFPEVAWSDSAFVPELEPGDVSGSEWGAESQLAPGSNALADGMEMPPERAVPNPQLLPTMEPRWPPRGPARQRGKPGQGRYSPRFAHALKAVTGQNEVPEVDGEPVDEAVFQEGSSHTLPISHEGTEDVQAAGAPGAGEEHTKGIYIKDAPMFCLKGAIGVFVPVLLIIIVCCVCIRRRRQKHQRLMESAKARAAAHGRSAHEDRRSRHHRAPHVPGRPARVLRSPSRSPPPRPKRPPTRPPSPAFYTQKARSPQPRRAPPPPPPPTSFRGW